MPSTIWERCRAFSVRMRPGHAFSHVTAAQLLGLALPLELEDRTELDVTAVHPAIPPRAEGIIGHRLRVAPSVIELRGLTVCGTLDTWCQLSGLIELDDLVVIADRFLTDLPLPEREVRERLIAAIGRSDPRTRRTLRRAVDEARRGSASPGETRRRLVLVRAGLPEPELNVPLFGADGSNLGRPDIVYRRQRVVFEYEGDGHRERKQFRYDVERYERLSDEGWVVVRVTGDDLKGDRRERLVERARSRLGVEVEADRPRAAPTSSGPPAAR